VVSVWKQRNQKDIVILFYVIHETLSSEKGFKELFESARMRFDQTPGRELVDYVGLLQLMDHRELDTDSPKLQMREALFRELESFADKWIPHAQMAR
jgi:hypothetical protein